MCQIIARIAKFKDGRNSFRPYENLPVETRTIASVLSRLDSLPMKSSDLWIDSNSTDEYIQYAPSKIYRFRFSHVFAFSTQLQSIIMLLNINLNVTFCKFGGFII